MDPRIRAGIFGGESGGGYDTLFGHSERPGGAFAHIRPTQMTIQQIMDFQNPSGPYGRWVAANRPDKHNGVATPVGAYQVVGGTLRNAVQALGLSPDTIFSPAVQDMVGDYILKTQGTGAWVGYKGPRTPGEPLRHVGGAGSGPANFNRPGGEVEAPYSTAPMMADATDPFGDLADALAESQRYSSLADAIAKGVGGRKGGGKTQDVAGDYTPSLPPAFEPASGDLPQPGDISAPPLGDLASLFQVGPIGQAAPDPSTGLPILPRQRRA